MPRSLQIGMWVDSHFLCVLKRTCVRKLWMTIIDCLLTDCGISSLHRKLPRVHSNYWIPHLIAFSNLRSFWNSQAVPHYMAYPCQNLNILYRQCSLYEPSNYSILLLLLLLLCGREKISFTLEVSVYTQLYTCTLDVAMYPSLNAAHLLRVCSCCCSQSSLYVPCASTIHLREQPDVLICAGCGWTYPAPMPRSPQIGMWMDGHFLCVRKRTCVRKLQMKMPDCLQTDCGISSLHRTPPSVHSNHWIPHLIAFSNLRSISNEVVSHLCCHCACCLSGPLPTPLTCEL